MHSIQSFSDQNVIAIKAPPDTKLEVPDVADKIQVFLHSERGPIEVFVPEDAQESTVPEEFLPERKSSATGVSLLMKLIRGVLEAAIGAECAHPRLNFLQPKFRRPHSSMTTTIRWRSESPHLVKCEFRSWSRMSSSLDIGTRMQRSLGQ